ncbi:MAG: AgmX/PglI C-terminal domain-containing protein [Myxococcota bacterium]
MIGLASLVGAALAASPAIPPRIRADGPRDPAPVSERIATLHEPIVVCIGTSPATLTLSVESSGAVSARATGPGAACLERLFTDWALPEQPGIPTTFVVELAERRGLGNRAGYVGPPPNLATAPSAVTIVDTGLPAHANASLGEPVILGPIEPAELRAVFDGALGSLQRCHEAESNGTVLPIGRVSLKVVIDKAGAVSASTIRASTLGHAGIEACIQNVGKTLVFPASPTGAISIVTMPVLYGP